MTNYREEFDARIGRLDRCLSEFLDLYSTSIDEADRQTLKHHADDLIGVGGAMLENLGRLAPSAEMATLKTALKVIASKRYAAEYHDGSPTGPDAIRDLQKIATTALGDEQ